MVPATEKINEEDREGDRDRANAALGVAGIRPDLPRSESAGREWAEVQDTGVHGVTVRAVQASGTVFGFCPQTVTQV